MMLLTAIVSAALLSTPDTTDQAWWEAACDREKTETAADRKENRARARAACRDLGAKADVCEMLDAVVMRESDGRADVKHTRGKGEFGIGITGLSVKLHLWKWSARAPQESLCIPEVSTVITLRIWRGAVRQYGAKNKLDLQRVFGGRVFDVGLPPAKDLDGKWCRRLAKRGQSCLDRISLKDFGKGPTIQTQDAWLQDRLAEVGKDAS